MKVICINDEWGDNKDGNEPKLLEIVTAIGQSEVYPDKWYIAEYPRAKCGIRQSFSKINFAPLSEIDETEFERNYKKELV